LFSENRLEKHGDAAVQDSSASPELDNSVPTRNETAIETHFGGDEVFSKKGLVATQLKFQGHPQTISQFWADWEG
jgi:hypothetical protein